MSEPKIAASKAHGSDTFRALRVGRCLSSIMDRDAYLANRAAQIDSGPPQMAVDHSALMH